MPVGFPATESGVELRILARLFTVEQAEIALELSAVPESLATIHKRLRTRLTPEELQEKLDRMADQGLIMAFPGASGFHYGKLMWVIGIYERQSKRLTAELEWDCRQYLEEAFGRALHSGKTPQLRVVPVSRPIDVKRSVSTYDHIREFIASSPGPFGTIACICRHGRDLVGEPCRQTDLRENCLMIGPAAKWAAVSGVGQAISREEMLGLLDRAEQDGLVLEAENTKSPMFVCCCCGCCCGVLTSAKRLDSPATYFWTNYYASVDPNLCENCGACEARCQLDAISTAENSAEVHRSRCIGCAVCLSTCPSGAISLQQVENPKIPPDDTKALYMRMYQDRFGGFGLMKLGLHAKLGAKT